MQNIRPDANKQYVFSQTTPYKLLLTTYYKPLTEGESLDFFLNVHTLNPISFLSHVKLLLTTNHKALAGGDFSDFGFMYIP